MKDYQRAFLDFAIEAGAIRFGEFVLKSERVSPYFFNAGCFSSGSSLLRLGQFYATAIVDAGVAFDMLFGPAYKGIPLAATTAIALAADHQRDVPYAFNRKEAKRYAERGVTVGAPLRGNVLIVDDVISAGQSIAEAIGLIKQAGATPAGVVIALDRQERGAGTRSAVQDVETSYAVEVICIASLDTLITYLTELEEGQHHLAAIAAYRRRYGV